MSNLDDLKRAWQDAEGHAQKIMADKDQALEKVRERYATRLQDANDKAAQAQHAYLQAEAASALADREDAASTARALIEQGGLTPEAVAAAGITID